MKGIRAVVFSHLVSICIGATYPSSPDSDPPSQWASMSSAFSLHCSPFGISMFAETGFDRTKFNHACNVMAQYLDNDQDGCADDVNVVKMMRLKQGGMAMTLTESSGDREDYPDTFRGQSLYATETEPSCSGSSETSSCHDAALEEILHCITANGVSQHYSDEFGECYNGEDNLSDIQAQMDIARGGHFTSVPDPYPEGSVYHYDDATCGYECMVTEMFYWGVTSLLGGQDARAEDLKAEWEAPNAADLLSKLPGFHSLLISEVTSMKLLSDQGVLPGTGSATGATGTYNPQSQTCLTSSGCSLDGSGCGPLGTDRDVEMCSNSPPSPPVSSPVSSPVAGPTQGDVNGEEACENHGYTESECLSVGIDDDCCEWDENECWSKIEQQTCVMSSNPTPSSPVVAPSPVSPPVSSPVSSPVAGPTQGDVNGEEACEEHGYTESECLSIGIDDDCCEWDENECWSKIGQQTCVMSSNPTPSSPVVAPSPVSSPSECVDSELRMVVNKGKRLKCAWVAKNTAKRCGKWGVSQHCPETCGKCNDYQCSDSRKKFILKNNFSVKKCKWVGSKPSKVAIRCGKSGVSSTCRSTCGFCD